ncbi:hypothetical protein KSP39_PZI012910 [Platanthera zijinensis]|uniref:Uncharacterized protein n=1 Tax=Platanthera zijinensis TaxID=2320716 RepID=A0AAP0G2U4_9ASPA
MCWRKKIDALDLAWMSSKHCEVGESDAGVELSVWEEEDREREDPDGISAAGSVHNIYGSLLSLENHYFRNEACKSLLIRPFDAAVQKMHSSLAICIENPSETRTLFYCGNCFSGKNTVCLYPGAKCGCGGIMNRTVSSSNQNGIKGAVFVKEAFSSQPKHTATAAELNGLRSSPSFNRAIFQAEPTWTWFRTDQVHTTNHKGQSALTSGH